jgi:ubiquinone/menaquinone biosynthesis C-methylase UbiE
MKSVIEQFSKRAGSYSGSAQWISDVTLIQAHIDASGRKPPGHVLEICCGTGMVGRNFQAAGWHVCGVDLTQHMAEEANRFFPCICTPAESIPFLDKSFDLVVLRQAYFLLDNGQKVLAEAARVLKDDGLFIFSQTVPYSAVDRPWLEHIHRTKQFQLREFYTEESLANELEQEYFRVEQVRRLSVAENINRWMAAAPELSPEKQAEVCALVANAPDEYRRLHDVRIIDGEVFENWNWVIFTARKN